VCGDLPQQLLCVWRILAPWSQCSRSDTSYAAFATAAVVGITFAAALGMWKALPGSASDGPVVVSRAPAHARPMAGMHMAGMKMPGMKMPDVAR
jgi:hypothetical protein